MTTMVAGEDSSIQTRASLLNRLKTGGDTESWQEFYRIYGKLVRDFSLKAGLTDTEADEVVQDTALAISRHLPEYQYDPKVCRFKTWLLNQASWRVKDQLKKRKMGRASHETGGSKDAPTQTRGTATINRIADPAAVDLDVVFENEWRKNLLSTALEQIKSKFSLKQFQIFDLLVLKEWSAPEVARSLGVSLASVYVTKHRVANAVRKEVKRLERKMQQQAERHKDH